MSPPKQQPPPPVTLTLPSPLNVSFDPATSIRVAVESPAKTPFQLNARLATLLWVFAMSVSVWSLLFYRYVIERSYSPQPIAIGGTPLIVTLAHPARVAYGDEAELDVIVANQGADGFTGALVVSLTGAHLLPGENGAVKIEALNGKESKTYRMKFALLPKPHWYSGGAVRTSLQAYANNRPLAAAGGQHIPIARLPYARTFILWLRNSVAAAAIALLLWEVVRKVFLGWEAKG